MDMHVRIVGVNAQITGVPVFEVTTRNAMYLELGCCMQRAHIRRTDTDLVNRSFRSNNA